MQQNHTAEFLGGEYTWSKVQIELCDVQPLMGGVRVLLPSFSGYQMFVTRYAPGGEETKYKLALGWDEKKDICALCVAQDFLTIAADDALGIPDEARPTITLTNARGESHTVARWASAVAQDARFAAVNQALQALAERTDGQRPMPRRLEAWQKGIFWGGAIAILLALAALASFPARALVAAWWPARWGVLLGGHALLMALLLVVLVLIGRRERRFMRWDRPFMNPFMLAAVNLFIFLSLVGDTGMVEMAIATWRGAPLPAADDQRALYAILAYTALFAAWLTLLAAALVGKKVVRWADERF